MACFVEWRGIDILGNMLANKNMFENKNLFKNKVRG